MDEIALSDATIDAVNVLRREFRRRDIAGASIAGELSPEADAFGSSHQLAVEPMNTTSGEQHGDLLGMLEVRVEGIAGANTLADAVRRVAADVLAQVPVDGAETPYARISIPSGARDVQVDAVVVSLHEERASMPAARLGEAAPVDVAELGEDRDGMARRAQAYEALDVLARNGVTSLEVTLQGYGDNNFIDNWHMETAGKGLSQTFNAKAEELADAMGWAAEGLICANNGGWEIDEGGTVHATFDLEKSTFSGNLELATEYSVPAAGGAMHRDLGPFGAADNRLGDTLSGRLARLRDAGVERLQLRLAGAGDSGSLEGYNEEPLLQKDAEVSRGALGRIADDAAWAINDLILRADGNTGWEIDDGGSVEITLDLRSGALDYSVMHTVSERHREVEVAMSLTDFFAIREAAPFLVAEGMRKLKSAGVEHLRVCIHGGYEPRVLAAVAPLGNPSHASVAERHGETIATTARAAMRAVDAPELFLLYFNNDRSLAYTYVELDMEAQRCSVLADQHMDAEGAPKHAFYGRCGPVPEGASPTGPA